MGKRIFVSHAVKDKKLIDLFVENILISGMNISIEDIFYSSLPEMGIPTGEYFSEYIKNQIQTPEVVIIIVSKSYVNSQFCLCELGAAWAMAHTTLPLIVSPVEYNDLQGVLSGVQVDKIDCKEDLNRFCDCLKKIMNINVSTSRWDRLSNKFINESEKLICELKNNIEKSADVLSLEKKYNEAQEELSTMEKELEAKTKLIGKLRNCKDKEECEQTIFEDADEAEKFKELTLSVNKTFDLLPPIVPYVIYKERYKGMSVCFDSYNGEEDLQRMANEAEEEGYLTFDEPSYFVNEEDVKVKDALECLKRLNTFLKENISEDFCDGFSRKYAFAPELKNKRFWREVLAVNILK